MTKYASEHPDIAHLEYDNCAGGMSYIIDKSRISMTFRFRLSGKEYVTIGRNILRPIVTLSPMKNANVVAKVIGLLLQ